ncbi:hypothetical protein [Peribacillus asahii]|uniref:hypothetical protein n=1 Tax=Peribacillus asahii TaxID=228899 RepID=UPI00207A5AD8|nr:hypothetical protein [Peribacillus asahii]USK60413.1 hypothetical protein LIT37_03415 [Peribacillus asahii]
MMLLLEDQFGNSIKAYKTKEMSTESYDYSIHRTKIGYIDDKAYRFHHYNYGSTFYFIYKDNRRWYKINYSSERDLKFKIVGKVRE